MIPKEPKIVTEAYEAKEEKMTIDEAKKKLIEKGIKEEHLTPEFLEKFIEHPEIEYVPPTAKEERERVREIPEEIPKGFQEEKKPELTAEELLAEREPIEKELKEIEEEEIPKAKLKKEEKPTIRGIDFEKNPEVYRAVAKADDIIEQSKLKIKYPLGEIDTAIKELKDAMMDKTLNKEQKRQISREFIELKTVQKEIKMKPAEYTEIEIPKAKMLPEKEKAMMPKIEVGKEAKGKVKVYHLSTEKDLKMVDPELMGKGEAGREMARVREKGFEKTSAWYTEETPDIEDRFKMTIS